jgi:hypothetical protein
MATSAWLGDVVRALRAGLPQLDIAVLDDFATYPVELIFGPLRAHAVAGLASSALVSLHHMYRVRAYCPLDRLTSLARGTPMGPVIEPWRKEYDAELVGV